MDQAVEELYVMEKIGAAPDSELYGFVAFSECLEEYFLKVRRLHRFFRNLTLAMIERQRRDRC